MALKPANPAATITAVSALGPPQRHGGEAAVLLVLAKGTGADEAQHLSCQAAFFSAGAGVGRRRPPRLPDSICPGLYGSRGHDSADSDSAEMTRPK